MITLEQLPIYHQFTMLLSRIGKIKAINPKKEIKDKKEFLISCNHL